MIEIAKSALLIFLTVVLHELGHVIAASSLGLKVREIGFNRRGVYIVREAGPPVANVVVSLAGPFLNLLIAAIFVRYAPKFGVDNLLMSIVNLLPLPFTDGRRVLDLLARNRKTV